jgi:tetratricopeptide (TPR) repeat protein
MNASPYLGEITRRSQRGERQDFGYLTAPSVAFPTEGFLSRALIGATGWHNSCDSFGGVCRMRTHVKALEKWLGIGALSILSSSAVVSAAGSFSGAYLETMDQYTRIQIPVSTGSSFKMMNGRAGEVTLVVDRVATGATDRLPTFTDPLIKQVTVKTLGLDKVEVTVHFSDSQTESFAYAQGSNLVLDLWHGKAKKTLPSVAVVAEKLPQDVKGRVPASPRGKFKATGRAAVFETTSVKAPETPSVAPLTMERDLFQRFLLPMPELKVTAKDGGLDIPLQFELDSRWKFTQGDKETDEGKGFEFAKKLYFEKKYGLCLKMIEIVLRDHPKAEYVEELRLLRALAYRKLGESTKTEPLLARGEKMLQELSSLRTESGVALPFTRLLTLHFAKNELEKESWLEAIQHLEYVSSATKPNDADFPYVQMLMAEAYSKINQPRRAERLYRFLTEKFPKHPLAREAKYRIADLLAQEKNYARVIDEGTDAINAYPEYEKTRSEVLFHLGEAYFWLGNYAKAEKNFRRYVSIASAQTTASLAWVRLGEIAELARGDLKSAGDDYYHAKNGYPFSKGDLVATVRLARIDLPTEKDPKYVVRTLEQLLSDKTVEWDVKRMAEITLADYLFLTGDPDKAIAIASEGMAQTDGNVFLLYKKAYEKGLYTKLHQFVTGKKYAEALSLYEHEKKWLEGYGPETFHALSEAYRGLGLFASANQWMERFTAELAKGTRGPSSVSARFSREKASNSFARGAYEEALQQLGEARDPQSEYIRAGAHYHLGQKVESYIVARRLVPQLSKGLLIDEQVENLGEILFDHDGTERDFALMERDSLALRALCANDNERLAFTAADALWYQKKPKEAEVAYRAALAKFPSGIRSERGRYNLGMALVAQGKREEAVKLMTELRNSGQSVWSESAKQELELIDWERKYSSVLRTLPPSGLGIAN